MLVIFFGYWLNIDLFKRILDLESKINNNSECFRILTSKRKFKLYLFMLLILIDLISKISDYRYYEIIRNKEMRE